MRKITNIYGNAEYPYYFSNCCGALYTKATPKTNFQRGHKGIKVWDEKVGNEYNGPKQSLHHVNTKNGTITISIRKAY